MIALLGLALGAGACSRRALPGRPAPGFRLRLRNGKQVTLASFRGRVLVLNFWASWCPPCVEETPALNALSKVFPPSRVTVLGISIDEDPVAYRTFLNRYRITYPTGRDPSQAIMHRFGTVQIPETYIIDANGRVARKLVSVANFTSPTMIAYLRALSGSEPGSPASPAPSPRP
jgi:cytochrome c biogenesis protein CcmG/thiol:disulfide interchange protein DsbE